MDINVGEISNCLQSRMARYRMNFQCTVERESSSEKLDELLASRRRNRLRTKEQQKVTRNIWSWLHTMIKVYITLSWIGFITPQKVESTSDDFAAILANRRKERVQKKQKHKVMADTCTRLHFLIKMYTSAALIGFAQTSLISFRM